MPSKNDLLQKLKKISDTDRRLWEAFCTAEDNSYISPIAIGKMIKMRSAIKGTKRWLVREHPTLLALSAIAAVTTPFALANSPVLFAVGMLVYSLSLFAAMLTRDTFVSEFSKHLLRTDNIVDHAFGIDKISLLVFHSFSQDKLLQGISQGEIGSIIKLVKAGHDYVNTTYGYYDYLRKGFIAALLALPITAWTLLQEHRSKVAEYWANISAFVRSDNFLAPAPVILTLLFVVALSILAYSLAFGDQRLERRKKRYLLWLNLLHESWQR